LADEAAAAAENDVIPAVRNQSHTYTASATLAAARADADAAELFDRATEHWQTYGHPLEAHIALASAAALRRADTPAPPPEIAVESVTALCPAVRDTRRSAT
jgi:hypothetical protein